MLSHNLKVPIKWFGAAQVKKSVSSIHDGFNPAPLIKPNYEAIFSIKEST